MDKEIVSQVMSQLNELKDAVRSLAPEALRQMIAAAYADRIVNIVISALGIVVGLLGVRACLKWYKKLTQNQDDEIGAVLTGAAAAIMVLGGTLGLLGNVHNLIVLSVAPELTVIRELVGR